MKKLILLLSTFLIIACQTETKVKVGQFWAYDCPNPFKTCLVINKVLAIKGNYVQFRNVRTSVINSSPIHYFKLGSKLLNDFYDSDIHSDAFKNNPNYGK